MSIGIWQLILILVIVLVIFGAGRLPRVMNDIGKGVRQLKKGLSEAEVDTTESPKVVSEDKAASDKKSHSQSKS